MSQTAQEIQEIARSLEGLSPAELKEIDEVITQDLPRWTPLPGPQWDAYYSPADILFFGGSAGGTKTELLLGLALNEHHRSIIFRREATQLQALIDRLIEIRGTRDGWNEQKLIQRLSRRQIEFGHCKDLGDEVKYQGRPHDLIAFDEICHFLESQFRFLMTWKRTVRRGQRKRVVCTGNPPTSQEGRWVVDYWGPWLNPRHPHPAKPGELRWYTTINGKDTEVPDGSVLKIKGKYVTPESRTFIPSRVTDNPFLMSTGYEATLQALPEPLRSQMLDGDFWAGVSDNEWQVIPTAWVDEAMARWTPEGKSGYMDTLGVDVARGGRDKTVLAPKYGHWFDVLRVFPGIETPDGMVVSAQVIDARGNQNPIIVVDVINVGTSVVDILRSNGIQIIAVNGAESAPDGAVDNYAKQLHFYNMRSYLWWRMREALDPALGSKVCLPPDDELKADLTAPLWQLTPRGIQVEGKEDRLGVDGMKQSGIRRRLGRSTDKGDAVVMANGYGIEAFSFGLGSSDLGDLTGVAV